MVPIRNALPNSCKLTINGISCSHFEFVRIACFDCRLGSSPKCRRSRSRAFVDSVSSFAVNRLVLCLSSSGERTGRVVVRPVGSPIAAVASPTFRISVLDAYSTRDSVTSIPVPLYPIHAIPSSTAPSAAANVQYVTTAPSDRSPRKRRTSPSPDRSSTSRNALASCQRTQPRQSHPNSTVMTHPNSPNHLIDQPPRIQRLQQRARRRPHRVLLTRHHRLLLLRRQCQCLHERGGAPWLVRRRVVRPGQRALQGRGMARCAPPRSEGARPRCQAAAATEASSWQHVASGGSG